MQRKRAIFNYRPTLLFALSLLAGVAVSLLSYVNIIAFICVPAAVVAAGTLFCLLRKKWKVMLVLVAFVCGYMGFFIEYKTQVKTFDGEQYFSCKVYDVSGAPGDYKLYCEDIEVDGNRCQGRLTLEVPATVKYDKCEVICCFGTLEKITPTVTDGYSMSMYGAGYRYRATATVLSARTEYDFIDRVKNRAVGKTDFFLSNEDAGIARGLLFGEKYFFSDGDEETMRDAGVSHVFAVSGMHVSFLILLLTAVFFFLRFNRYLKVGLLLPLLIFYCALCEFPPSAVRATIMAATVMLAQCTRRKLDPLSSLALAVSLIVLCSPSSLMSVGLILSVCAVLGILLFYAKFFSLFSKRFRSTRAGKYLAASVSLSLTANVVLFFVSTSVFGSFAWLFVPANLIIVPLSTFTYTLLFFIAVLNLISPNLGYLYRYIKYPIAAIRGVAELFSFLPPSKISLSPIVAVICVAALVLLSRFCLLGKKQKLIAGSSVGVVAVLTQIVIVFA